MSWAGKSHPIELAASWGAPMLLGAGCAWSTYLAGVGLPAAAVAFAAGLAAGSGAIRLAGGAQAIAGPEFDPLPLELDSGQVLLLDDPLVEVDASSRVVQLFASRDPTPGELVLRISDYLIENGREPVVARLQADEPPPDASAALHAALANIRASLR